MAINFRPIKSKIEAPGNHIKPKYDLDGLRARKEAQKAAKSTPPLPLTSMIDMLSMLVIFLIMNFSEQGDVFFNQKDEVKLPRAENAAPLEGLPLISVLEDRVLLEMPDTVIGKKVSIEDNDLETLLRVRRVLRYVKQKHDAENPGKEFRGAVNIQADTGVESKKIKMVMNALITEQWLEINFAVRKFSGKSQKTAMRN